MESRCVVFGGKNLKDVLQELCDFIDEREINKDNIIKIDITDNADETYTRIILIYFEMEEFDGEKT